MAQTAIRRLFWVFLLRARCKHGMRFKQGIYMYGVTTAGLLMKVSEALTCYGQVSLSCRALLRVQNCRDNVYLLAEAAACAQQPGRLMPYCQLKARSRKWLSHCLLSLVCTPQYCSTALRGFDWFPLCAVQRLAQNLGIFDACLHNVTYSWAPTVKVCRHRELSTQLDKVYLKSAIDRS